MKYRHYNTRLREYQRNAVSFLLDKPYRALFAEMTLGKTVITLLALEEMKTLGVLPPVLLVAPASTLATTWPDEISDWGFDFSYEVLVGGKPPARKKQLEKQVDIYMVSYELLPWLVEQRDFKKLKVLVCDEITKLKSTKSVRFRALRKHLKQFSKRIGLTGMPVSNHLIDLFGVMYVVDAGETFPKKTEFLGEFFHNVSHGDYPIYKVIQGAEKKIHKKIAKNSLVLETSDYLNLPPYVYSNVLLELPKELDKLYHSLEQDFLAEIQDVTIAPETAAVLSTKLRQVTSGFLYGEEEVLQLHDLKIQATKDYVEQLVGEPTIIAYYYQETRRKLAEAFPRAPQIGKGVKGEELRGAVRKWNSGEAPVLLMHASKGHGLNLQFSGHRLFWYELTWIGEDYAQLNARLRRVGQRSNHVFIHHCLIKGTIDERMLKSLKDKKSTQDRLFQAIKQDGKEMK